MAKGKKSWQQRLTAEPSELTVNFVESLSYDKRLYKYDITGSVAHAQMLCKQKLIAKDEFEQIEKGLNEIGAEIAAGKFKFDKSQEDIHMAIESALIERIGDAGKKLHTGRSRNDQVATDVRLWIKDQIKILQDKLTVLQKAFVELAEKNAENVMPGYTHMQRAQPISIGAYLLSFVEQFERDFVRFGNCMSAADVSVLGSGAIAGTTLAIDAESTAKQLGFGRVSRSSIDAVSDRDFCAEFIFDCAMTGMHLSRLAEDWIIYCSNEFNFIRIDDAYCTSSSMMPQKRNPDLLELIRAKAGGLYGSLMAVLTILKGLPGGYNRDLQEDKIHLFSASDSIEASLDVAAAIVSHSQFNAEKIADGLYEGFLDATALAEYLVGKGVAFRQAHGIVGSLVTYCEKEGKKLCELSLEEFHQYYKAVGDDVCEAIGPENVVNKYVSYGSAGPQQVSEQISYWKEHLKKR